MKKLRLLPSIFMLVACVAVLGVGVFAVAPTQNTISGSITINSANPEVRISAYGHKADGSLDESNVIMVETPARSGINIDLKSLTFDTSNCNSEEDLAKLNIKVTIRVSNPSKATLGVYFSTEPVATQSTKQLIKKEKALKDSTGSIGFVKATMDGYQELSAKSGETNGVVNTTITFSLLQFATGDTNPTVNLADEDNKMYLNIEEYNADILIKTDADYEALGYSVLGKGLTTLNSTIYTASDITENTKISDSVTTIEAKAFSGNTSFKNLVIPSTVTSIGANAFKACTNLETVLFERNINLTILGTGGDGYYSLDEEHFDGIFYNCSKLKSVDLSGLVNLKTIGNYTFQYCSLTQVKLPDSIEEVGYDAFGGTLSNSLIEIDGVRYLGSKNNPKLILHSITSELRSTITSFEIPSETKIILGAFSGASKLEKVIIPKTVTHLAPYSFASTAIRNIFVPSTTKLTAQYYIDGWYAPFYECYDSIDNNWVSSGNIRVCTDSEGQPSIWSNDSKCLHYYGRTKFEIATGISYEDYYKVINGEITEGEIYNKVYGEQ